MKRIHSIAILLACLFAGTLSAATLTLTWNDNSNNEDGFRVQRRVADGEWAPLAETAANVSTFEDSDILPNTAYAYRVLAFNTWGVSGWSNEATITTGTPPAAPGAATITITITINVQAQGP